MAVNLGHPRRARGDRRPRVHQPPRRHVLVRPARRERAPGAARRDGCGASATSSTGRGRWAPRPRTSTAGSRTRPPRRCGWSTRPSSWSPSAARTTRCPRSAAGSAPCSSTPTARSTTSRCTPTTRSTTATGASFLASAVDMDSFIDEVAAIADQVGAAVGSSKRLTLSFDEWNVWYQARFVGQSNLDWTFAPHLIEDDYTAVDAVVVGSLMMSLLEHSDRVAIACQAQLVNVIAPIRTLPGRSRVAAERLPPVRPHRAARAGPLAAHGGRQPAPRHRALRPGRRPAGERDPRPGHGGGVPAAGAPRAGRAAARAGRPDRVRRGRRGRRARPAERRRHHREHPRAPRTR